MHQAPRPWTLILMSQYCRLHDGAGMRSLLDDGAKAATLRPKNGSQCFKFSTGGDRESRFGFGVLARRRQASLQRARSQASRLPLTALR
jgi:hypothetical protein